jgi:hypothetical protein
MLALAGLLAATVMVSEVAVAGLGAVDARAQELYQHNILTTEAIAELQATLDDAAGSALQLLLFEGTADRSRLLADLRGRIVPRVDERIAVLQKAYGADPDADPARLERLSEGWGDVKRLIRSGLDPRDEAQKQAMTRQVVAAVDPITTLVAEMAATEVEHARESQEGAEATYRATRWRVLGIAATAALVWLVISLLLIRTSCPESGPTRGSRPGWPTGSRPGSSAFAGPTSWPSSGTPSTRWSGAAARSVAMRSPRPSSPTPCSSARPSARLTSSSSITWSGRSTAAR